MENIYKLNFITSGIFFTVFILNIKDGDYSSAFPALGAAIGWFAYGTELTKGN